MHIPLPPLLSETLPPLSLCLLSCNLSSPIGAPNVSWTCGLLQECSQITMNYTVQENQFFSGYQWKIGPQIGVELHPNLPAYSRIWFGHILHSSCVYYELVHMRSCPAHLSARCYFLVLIHCLLCSSCLLFHKTLSLGERMWCRCTIGNWEFHSLHPWAPASCGWLCVSHLVQQIETSLDEGERRINLWVHGHVTRSSYTTI